MFTICGKTASVGSQFAVGKIRPASAKGVETSGDSGHNNLFNGKRTSHAPVLFGPVFWLIQREGLVTNTILL